MFKQALRLPAQRQLADGIVIHSPFFILKTKKNDLSHNRYGFVVSKKISMSAVIRNRIRRQFRACLEELDTNIHQGNDLLFILKKAATTVTKQALYDTIQSELQKKSLL